MDNCLTLVRVHLNLASFRLIWNGKAMIDWNSDGNEEREITTEDPQGMGKILYLMGREAAAVCAYYGYPADSVPTEQELTEYLSVVASPWELAECITAIAETLKIGNHRDYKPEEDGRVDLDTLELKKN